MDLKKYKGNLFFNLFFLFAFIIMAILLSIGLIVEISSMLKPKQTCEEFCVDISSDLSGTEINSVCVCHNKELKCYPAELGTAYLICGNKNDTKKLL